MESQRNKKISSKLACSSSFPKYTFKMMKRSPFYSMDPFIQLRSRHRPRPEIMVGKGGGGAQTYTHGPIKYRCLCTPSSFHFLSWCLFTDPSFIHGFNPVFKSHSHIQLNHCPSLKNTNASYLNKITGASPTCISSLRLASLPSFLCMCLHIVGKCLFLVTVTAARM